MRSPVRHVSSGPRMWTRAYPTGPSFVSARGRRRQARQATPRRAPAARLRRTPRPGAPRRARAARERLPRDDGEATPTAASGHRSAPGRLGESSRGKLVSAIGGPHLTSAGISPDLRTPPGYGPASNAKPGARPVEPDTPELDENRQRRSWRRVRPIRSARRSDSPPMTTSADDRKARVYAPRCRCLLEVERRANPGAFCFRVKGAADAGFRRDCSLRRSSSHPAPSRETAPPDFTQARSSGVALRRIHLLLLTRVSG